MEITYTDSEGNESTIVPLRFEAEPLVYHVPSSLTYEGSTEQSSSWTDWYTHPGGWKLSVQRYFLELEGDGTDDGYAMLAFDAAAESEKAHGSCYIGNSPCPEVFPGGFLRACLRMRLRALSPTPDSVALC